ncbi:Ff.00g019660.m01.CDS01 [Fusarium sp. VM40]|nr:Ff.00g019660.m01.CDS01 [Fusarium sp. VM40]
MPVAQQPQSLPRIDVCFTPSLIGNVPNGQEHARLKIQMAMDVPLLQTNEAILVIDTKRETVPAQPYTNESISFVDEKGPLPTFTKDDDNTYLFPRRTWYITRPTEGKVSMAFTAVPRKVDEYTKVAARTDLRYERGGLHGSGITILPMPAFPDASKQTWEMTVQWNLSETPPDTRAVWTFGEGPRPVTNTGSVARLWSTLLSVGPLNSCNHQPNDFFNVYWLGELPSNIVATLNYSQLTFLAMSKFWKDPMSAKNPYRIFVRNTLPAKGFGGTEFTRSYMMEYDDQIDERTETDLTLLLTHEMVHNWPSMGKAADEEGADEENEEGSWFTEGVADLYAAYLPYKFGLKDAEWYREALNVFLAGYYTNPAVRVPNSEARRKAWELPSYQMMIYARGFAYLQKLDGQIREAAGGRRSVDDLVTHLIMNKRKGLAYGIDEWRKLVLSELGCEAIQDYEQMTQGALQIPNATTMDPPMRLVRDDLEMVELGFEPISLSSRVVAGLKPGSRAEKAGVRNGDEILKSISLWTLSAKYGAMNQLTIRRANSDEVLEVKYWPRSWEKVEAYQYVRQ